MALRVEIIGLPGSGKTTLMQMVAPMLADQGIRVVHQKDLDTCDQHTGPSYPVLRRSERTRQALHIGSFTQAHPKLWQFFAKGHA